MMDSRRFTSQNGRWGVELVSESIPMDDLGYGSAPVQASATKLGNLAGHELVRLERTHDLTWVLVGGDLEVIEGATKVASSDLQGGYDITVLLLGPHAIVRSWGYKRRVSALTLYVNGTPQRDVGPAVMVALGLIKLKHEPEAVTPPPPPSDAMAAALKAAGLSPK